jgi:hypothetical protein
MLGRSFQYLELTNREYRAVSSSSNNIQFIDNTLPWLPRRWPDVVESLGKIRYAEANAFIEYIQRNC